MNFIRSFSLTSRFFYVIAALIISFVISYFIPFVFYIGYFLIGCFIIIFIIDFLLLYFKNGILAFRSVPEKLSNGDKNKIVVQVENLYPFDIQADVIDEIPFQFQIRNFFKKLKLKAIEKKDFDYFVTPKSRGIYNFGHINIYASTQKIGLVSRRYTIEVAQNQEIPCYPSYIQLKKYELIAFSMNLIDTGLKRMRKMGSSNEFEKINQYVKGDDIRHINWKASAKRNNLMVNKFIEEKSQTIYSIIDTGRAMQMPFDGLSLLDYAINSSLVISNIAIRKDDKAGIAAFSTSFTNLIVADRRSNQMQLIMQTLYNIQTEFKETDFGRLYVYLKHKITQRSLLILYTNFETKEALERQLKYLKAINKNHLLLIILFKNTALETMVHIKAKDRLTVYDKTIADKFINEKKLIIKELNKNGILSVLTTPQNLIVNTINKYLEIKAKNLL